MSVKLTTSLSQRLVLTPQLRQRIEMLQMTTIELGELIQQQLLENPVIEEVVAQEEKREIEENIIDQLAGGQTSDLASDFAAREFAEAELNGNSNGTSDLASIESLAGGTETATPEVAASTGDEFEGETTERDTDAFEEIDFGREFQEYLDPGYKTQEYEHKEDGPTFEQFLTRPESLSEHLMWQLSMSHVAPQLLPVAEAIIGNLDPDGRLNATNEEIAQFGDWADELVEEARQIVMRLDPVGCGARDVRECLLVQLEACGAGHTPRRATHPRAPARRFAAAQTAQSLQTDRRPGRDASGRTRFPARAQPASGQAVFIGRAGLDRAGSLHRKS
jgi:RNA polymerase sigma-54 factor